MQVEDLLIKHTTENNTDKAAEFIQDKNTKDAGLRVSGTGMDSAQVRVEKGERVYQAPIYNKKEIKTAEPAE